MISKPKPVSTQDRSFHDWTDKEDDAIMEACLNDGNDGNDGNDENDGLNVGTSRLADLALKFRREPLLILERIRCSDVMDMLGFECDVNADEEIEFFGLALAGAPLGLALRWCSATANDDGSGVTTAEIEVSLTGPDMRGPLSLARDLGLWNAAGNAAQRSALLEIFGLADPAETARIAAVIAAILERFDAPTPVAVLAHLKGVAPAEPKARAYPWGTPGLSAEKLFETIGNDWLAGSKGSPRSSGAGKFAGYRRRNSSSAAGSSASKGAPTLASSSETTSYASAGKRKPWGRKRKVTKAKKTGFGRYAYPW